jgi:hypothetical protein
VGGADIERVDRYLERELVRQSTQSLTRSQPEQAPERKGRIATEDRRNAWVDA